MSTDSTEAQFGSCTEMTTDLDEVSVSQGDSIEAANDEIEAMDPEPESGVASEGTSILGFVSKTKQISLVGIIESLFGSDESEFILVPFNPGSENSERNEIKTLQPIRQYKNSLSEPSLKFGVEGPKSKLIPEVDFCYRSQKNYDESLSVSRSASEVRIVNEERVELERKNMTSDSEEPFSDQLEKNKYLVKKLARPEVQFLQEFGKMTDGLLEKIELVCIGVAEGKEILDSGIHGKSGSSCPALELWNSILKLVIAQLNPPFHRKQELKVFIKTRLKEILNQVQTMSEVTANIVTQTQRMNLLIGRLMNTWSSKFREDVWTAVNTQKLKKLLDSGNEAQAHIHSAKITNMARPKLPKVYADIGSNESCIQVIWTEGDGLILRNLGQPQVFYTKMNFLDRRSIFNAMIREIMRLFNAASLKINTVAQMTRHDPLIDARCKIDLILMAIDGLMGQKESGKLGYLIEALMVNQLRKIEAKLQELHSSCIDLKEDCNRKLKDIDHFYRKRKKTFKGTSKKSIEALSNLIQDLQEVTLNFYIHKGALDFAIYANKEDLKKTRHVPQSLICTSDPNGNESVRIDYTDSLGQVLAKNPPEFSPELLKCSEQVQNFHSYCHDAITFLKRGIGSLAVLQYNLFSPMGTGTGTEPKSTLIGWLWILTKSIEELTLMSTSDPSDPVTQGVLALIPQYEKICSGTQSFQKIVADLWGKTETTANILQKVFQESKIRLYLSHRTFLNEASENKVQLGPNDVRIRMEAQAEAYPGLEIDFCNQERPADIPLKSSLELLRILVAHVNSEVKHANLAASHVQEMKGKENHVIIAWEMHKIKKFLKRLNTGKFIPKNHEDDVIGESVQDLLTELSRFQALVKYLAKASTEVCREMRHLEKTLFKLIEQTFSNPSVGAGKIQNFLPIRSRSRSPSRPLRARKGKGQSRESKKSVAGLRMELQGFGPISVLILESDGVVGKIKGAITSMTNPVNIPTEVKPNETEQKSNFLQEFLAKLQEIKSIISATILFAGQELHLPNSAVEPQNFQVSKVEAMCAIIANGVLELNHQNHQHVSNILPQHDHQLFEQMNILLKEAENLYGVSSEFLERKELHGIKTGVFKLSECLEIGVMNEILSPQLFWSTVVKRKRSTEAVEHGKSNLVISWLFREAGLDLKCTSNSSNSVQMDSIEFSSLSRDAKTKVLLKLIFTAVDLIRSTYKTIQDWSKELKIGEEFLRNLRKGVKQELKKIQRGDQNLISQKLGEMIHEINVAASCLENYKSTGKKLSLLLRETCNFLKANGSHKNLPSSSSAKIEPEGELKSAANIKTTWFTPIMVQIPIILPSPTMINEGN